MKLLHYYGAGMLVAAVLDFSWWWWWYPPDESSSAAALEETWDRPHQKRKRPHHHKNERRIPVQDGLKVPTPIIVLSLPKSGTSSLYQYFNCGGLKAAHTFATDVNTGKEYRLGTRFRKNFRQNLPLLTNTGHLQVYTDIGEVNGHNNCFYPSLQALESIARDYPNATLIVSHRPGWYQSITKFHLLGKRWKKWCPQFPNTTDPAAWDAFYQSHRQGIRDLVQAHPSLHFLEFDLTDPTAGQQLQDFTGISAACFGKCKPTMKCEYDTNVSTSTTTNIAAATV